MKRQEAVGKIRNIMRYLSERGMLGVVLELEESLAALGVFEVPDPETGLFSCGCGGKASFHYDVGTFNEYSGVQRISVCAGCDDCKISTAQKTGFIDTENKYDEVENETQSEARNDWNRSRGHREEIK